MNTLLLVKTARKRDRAAFKHALASSFLVPLSLALLLFLTVSTNGAVLAAVWVMFAPLAIIGSALGIGHVLYFHSIMKRVRN